MKITINFKWFLGLLLFCGFSPSTFSQTLKDVFTSSETSMVYLGVDFTKARLINDPGANTMDIKNRLFNSINDVVVNEPKKYDIAGAFHKTSISSDLTAVRARNEKVNAEDILSSNSEDFSRLTEKDIAAVVKALGISGKKGVGILFVVEGMKKVDKEGLASVWTVLIDLSGKKVLLAERFENKARGFGFRNMWASPIKGTIDNIDKGKYKDWKAKYGS